MYAPHRTIPQLVKYSTVLTEIAEFYIYRLVIGVSPVNYPDPGPRFKQKISYDVLCMKWIGQIELAR